MFVVFIRDGLTGVHYFDNQEDAVAFARAFTKCENFEDVEVFRSDDDDYSNLIFGQKRSKGTK